MMRRTSRFLAPLLGVAFAAAPLIASMPALAQSKPRHQQEAAPPPPPPQFHVDVATRPMALSRVGTTIPAGATIGAVSFNDTLCIGEEKPVYREHAFKGVPMTDFVNIFAEEAAAAGYRIANAGGSMFQTEKQVTPEILVGASLTALKEHGCQVLKLFGTNQAHIEATLTVDWQVYDPLEKKLLFRSTNMGSGTARMNVEQMDTFGHLPVDSMRAAFRDAAKNILANPDFVAAVRDSRGGEAKAGDPNALFPEASNNAAPPPPALAPIPRLALNTGAFKDEVAQLREQVVTVENADGTGSGFYIADGLLMTNEHVVHGTPHVKVRLLGGRRIDGEVVATDGHRDVALVKTESIGFPGMPLRIDPPELASQVYVIGSPKGPKNEGSIITGIVSAFRTEYKQPYIQSDAPVAHGNSGGPMLDEHGNVIGLTDLGTNGAAAVNLFIPIGDALKVLGVAFAPDSQGSTAALSKPNP